MITVRRDAVRTVHRRAEEINETAKQWVRHRGLKLIHAEVVKCDISATANTLKSQDSENFSPKFGGKAPRAALNFEPRFTLP
jgi:hypothetical protein